MEGFILKIQLPLLELLRPSCKVVSLKGTKHQIQFFSIFHMFMESRLHRVSF